ncbi:MAG: hypothetical protein KAF64_12470, partial [Hydrogenophaga sp.]|uniref:hypothetical protein n=1 Tax=Hydrogenophaga sp. TaxID=1904254 RepID=UPI0025BC52B9
APGVCAVHGALARPVLEPEPRLLGCLPAGKVETLLALRVRATANAPFVNESEPPEAASAPRPRKKKA